MSDWNWKDALRKVAPTIASVIGGPFAGMAVSALGSALGIDEPTEDKIASAFASGQLTSEHLAALKLGEQNLILKLKELGVKSEELAYADSKSARDMQVATGSRVPGLLALVVTVGFFGILGWMLSDSSVRPSEPLLVMLGSLGTAWTAIVSFYFGSSQGSKLKSELLAQSTPK